MPSYKDEKTGKWYCSFRYTDLTGKRVQKMKRGFTLKRDADKWERDFLSADIKDEITVGNLIDEYEANMAYRLKTGSLKQSTVELRKSTVRLYIKDYWKDIIVSKVKPKHVEEWISSIMDVKVKDVRPDCRYRREHPHEVKSRLSSNVLNRAKNTLFNIFELSILNHGFTINPVERVSNVKFYSPNLRAKLWSLEEYQKFREVVRRQDMLAVFDLMFFAGLRIGEVLALTPEDISQYKVSVNKALIETQEHHIYIDTPKTSSSIRTVELPQFLWEELDSLIKSSYNIKPTDILFNIKRATLREALNSGARKVNNPKISPHILRHSYASQMMTLTDASTVANQMGHCNPNTTLSTYTHMLPGKDRAAADALQQLVQNKK